MGGRQSRPEDVSVHSNPNDQPVSINFSPRLLDSLAKPGPSETYTPEEVEQIVRQKLAEQLDAIIEIEDEIRRFEEDAMAREIAERTEKMARESKTIRLTVPKAEVLVKERAVLECYKRNPDRPIDCWKEFEDFKEAARKAFQESVSA